MRIIDLKALRLMPEGTIFQKYAPCYFEDLQVFGGACGERDFIAASLTSCPIKVDSDSDMVAKLDRMEKEHASLPVDLEFFGRDGCFEDEQLFAIWESDDLSRLRDAIERAIMLPSPILEQETEG